MNKTPHTWPRLFLENKLSTGAEFPLCVEQSHYLTNVMRAGTGDSLRLFNGIDGEWRATIIESPAAKKRPVIIRLEEPLRHQNEEPDVWLCAAIIKRTHFDFLIMKATELGVRVIQPVLTTRTQIRDAKIERLTAIAVEAAEQSERLSVPEIRTPILLDSLLQHWPARRLPILCAEFGDAAPIATALNGALARERSSVAVLTGPEGGFAPEEMESLRTLPEILPVRLGPRILRADTAAIAALTCWQALRGDWANESAYTRG